METSLSQQVYGEAIAKATTLTEAEVPYGIIAKRAEKNIAGDKGWKVKNNLKFLEQYAKHITALGGKIPSELITKAKDYVASRVVPTQPKTPSVEFTYLPPAVAKSNISREEKARLNTMYATFTKLPK